MKILSRGFLAAALSIPAFAQKNVNADLDLDVQVALEQAKEALAQTTLQLAPLQLGEGKLDLELRAQLEDAQALFGRDRVKSETARALAQATKNNIAFQFAKAGGAYESGTRALDDRRYEDAVKQFDAVITAKGQRADGALYWKAYALDRAGRKDEALAALAKLRQDYPRSRWLNDAQALDAAVKQGSGQPSATADTNEDLKLMAINSLMNADPERAVPLLEGILKGNSAPRVKERALFVLTQSKAPRAAQLLTDYARGAGNPDMQIRAVRYLGMSGTPEARQQLDSVYSASGDISVKREIIRSLMMSKATDQMVNLAKNEKEPELRLEAIRQLGALRATPQLLQLYSSEASTDNKVAIVRNLMIAGAGDKLLDLVKTEKDPKVRTEAIRNMAMARNTPAESILQFYASETDAKVKRELINGLAMRGDAKTMVDLARKEADPALKKAIVERLSMSKSKEATEYMLELLK